MEKVSLREKFAAFTEHRRPKIVGELNGQEVELVKFQGVLGTCSALPGMSKDMGSR